MARRLRSIKGEGTVRRRPDGRYEGRVWLNDGRRISVYGATQREVTRQVRELKAQAESGKPIVRNQERLGTFHDSWLENEIKRRRRAKTYSSYEQMVRCHMLREIGSVKLTELSARRVQSWLDAKHDSGLSARNGSLLARHPPFGSEPRLGQRPCRGECGQEGHGSGARQERNRADDTRTGHELAWSAPFRSIACLLLRRYRAGASAG